MENGNNSAHAPLKTRHVVAGFSRALWQLRPPIAFLFVPTREADCPAPLGKPSTFAR